MSDAAHVRLRPHLSVIVHGPDEVEFRHGVWNPVSSTVADADRTGRLAGLVDALDGTVSAADVAAAQGVPLDEVQALVDRLAELELLEQRPSSALDAYLGTAAPWRVDDNLDPGQPVLLVGDGDLVSALRPMVSAVLVDNPVVVVPGDDPACAVLDDPDTSWLADGLATEEHLAPFEAWRGLSWLHRAGSSTLSVSRC